jgi:hypothetical protein
LGIADSIPAIPVNLATTDKGFTDALFRELRAHYSNLGIATEFVRITRDSAKETVYKFVAKGRDWETFENLIPGFIEVESAGDNIIVNADFGEENIWVSAMFEEIVQIHGSKIHSSNAPVQKSSYAQWINPSHMEVELSPALFDCPTIISITTKSKFVGILNWGLGILATAGAGFGVYKIARRILGLDEAGEEKYE